MTDAHCHVSQGDAEVRELLVGRDFFGVHPWDCSGGLGVLDGLEARLRDEPRIGVGEIGLDRLKERDISPQMREVFESQLALAARFARPVVLHGAKCWGEVVKACRPWADRIPSFLFHGFSRSDGLIPDIVALNGYVSVGSAVLNDHAVNYRKLVVKIPLDRLLVETDRTEENAATCPKVADVAAKVAELRGLSSAELERQTDANAESFIKAIRS